MLDLDALGDVLSSSFPRKAAYSIVCPMTFRLIFLVRGQLAFNESHVSVGCECEDVHAPDPGSLNSPTAKTKGVSSLLIIHTRTRKITFFRSIPKI